jgi:hypothetical protein
MELCTESDTSVSNLDLKYNTGVTAAGLIS